jgi:hypothetical protein
VLTALSPAVVLLGGDGALWEVLRSLECALEGDVGTLAPPRPLPLSLSAS